MFFEPGVGTLLARPHIFILKPSGPCCLVYLGFWRVSSLQQALCRRLLASLGSNSLLAMFVLLTCELSFI